MDNKQRRVRFGFFIEVSVQMETLTGKWSAKYRYNTDTNSESSWMVAGTQHSTASEAVDHVLSVVGGLFPELTSDWLAEARAKLSAD